MAVNPESPLDRLWQEYAAAFENYDDLTLARWMAQTLGQIEGKVWRLSHPLIGSYRLAAQVARDRGLAIHRLATIPGAYGQADCCGGPILPMLTRDVKEAGVGCLQCGGTLIAFPDLPSPLQSLLGPWADEYGPVHAVAHWDEKQQNASRNYNDVVENSAQKAEDLLAQIGADIAPRLLEHFPAVVWEDQDECLEVRPEDVPME